LIIQYLLDISVKFNTEEVYVLSILSHWVGDCNGCVKFESYDKSLYYEKRFWTVSEDIVCQLILNIYMSIILYYI
jgi:hypothetical protein